jgi:ATP-dependent HslUV protease ATP-binding subunit HslU
VNKSVENIGARRLHTVIERIIEDVSFDASDMVGQKFVVTAEYVKAKVSPLLKATDMRRYII